MSAPCESCEKLCTTLQQFLYTACFVLAVGGIVKVGPDLFYGLLGCAVLLYVFLSSLFHAMLEPVFDIVIGGFILAMWGQVVFSRWMDRITQRRLARAQVVVPVAVARCHPDDESW